MYLLTPLLLRHVLLLVYTLIFQFPTFLNLLILFALTSSSRLSSVNSSYFVQ